MLVWSKVPKRATAEGLSRSRNGELAFRGLRLAALRAAGGLLLSQPMVQAALAPLAPGCAVIPTLSQDLLPFPAAWLATSPSAVTIFCNFDSLNA